jgi:hypothetical protein
MYTLNKTKQKQKDIFLLKVSEWITYKLFVNTNDFNKFVLLYIDGSNKCV